MATKRTCMALDLIDNADLIASYEHHHTPGNIWPEIPAGIRAAGITDMQIYRIGTHLFMIVEHDDSTDLQTAFDKMATLPRQGEWAAWMDSFQQKLPEAAAGEHWATMKPVFLLNDH
ncbi:L-rhamnose mutarotase [Dyadobacter sp. SG02]|uniref:L-rhamnose mutarotase n=1 Tax=Dyadobacter sp. SG02 TaxID=1855291 RepID=UPI000B85F898|nr:L-rhamnose mutarotase [Dyadobacter sp. SG02]